MSWNVRIFIAQQLEHSVYNRVVVSSSLTRDVLFPTSWILDCLKNISSAVDNGWCFMRFVDISCVNLCKQKKHIYIYEFAICAFAFSTNIPLNNSKLFTAVEHSYLRYIGLLPLSLEIPNIQHFVFISTFQFVLLTYLIKFIEVEWRTYAPLS